MVAPLVTVTRVTRNEEAGVERVITDQQLVGVNIAGSNRVPQSTDSSIPVVRSGRYEQVGLSLEEDSGSSLVINKNDFCELKTKKVVNENLVEGRVPYVMLHVNQCYPRTFYFLN